MKFGSVALDEANGAYLAHAVHAGVTKLKKGTRLDRATIELLISSGITDVIVARLEDGDIGEDDAATRLANIARNPSVRLAAASTGRVNIYAEYDGLFVVDKAAIDAINRLNSSITIATLQAFATVARGQMVATAKIIPFAVQADGIEAAEAIGASLSVPLLHVAPWQAKRVGLIATTLPSLKPEVMDKTARVLAARLARSGSSIMSEMRVPHRENAVAQAISAQITAGAQMIVVFGASAVVDPLDVIPEGIRLSGGDVLQVGMPVDPGNLLVLGRYGDVPIIGAPGCARSPKENGFDWILDRLLCGIDVKPEDFSGMGVGGLLMEIETRPRPREIAVDRGLPKLDGLLLAAGRSSRMGGTHKLRATFDGEPLIARSAKALKACGVRSAIVVLGHEFERMSALLSESGTSVVTNPDFAEGLASSLRVGVLALPKDCDGVLVHLADMPGVTADAMRQMCEAFTKSGGLAIVRATHAGKRGNPVILPRSVFPQVARLTGDMGARAIVEGFGGVVIDVEIGAAASLDVDTPEALIAAGGTLSD